MQLCYASGVPRIKGIVIADTNADHSGSSGQAGRRESLGLFISKSNMAR
jgi:hypothetical protein